MLEVPEARMKQMGKINPLRLLYIEPYSAIIVRGDVLHAGAGADEAQGRLAPRFHMYLLREGKPLGDTIFDRVGSSFLFNDRDKSEMWTRRTRKF